MSRTEAEKLDPAKTVIERFSTEGVSGVRVVAGIAGLDRTSVHKWMWPKSRRGTGGLVPSRYHRALREAAEERGVDLPAELLTGEDFPATLNGAARS